MSQGKVESVDRSVSEKNPLTCTMKYLSLIWITSMTDESYEHTLGFHYQASANNVHISLNGLTVTTLRGKSAQDFMVKIADMNDNDGQQLMARLTGNYKRGNEKNAKSKQNNKYR